MPNLNERVVYVDDRGRRHNALVAGSHSSECLDLLYVNPEAPSRAAGAFHAGDLQSSVIALCGVVPQDSEHPVHCYVRQ